MACERCAGGPDRRAFLEQLLAIVGGTAGLAACAANAATAPSITAFTVNIANYPALATVGGLVVVDTGSRSGDPIAVSRTGTSTFLALSLICPHRGSTVEISGPGFYCPGHGATFSTTGTWTGGQSTSSLARYAISYDPTAGTLTIG